jgi:trimeric autotransporter adhesin
MSRIRDMANLNSRVVKGNTASRPTSSTSGDMYANTQTGFLEIYSGTAWIPVGVAPTAPASLVATDVASGRAFNNGSASISFSAGTIAGSSYTITSSPGSYTATGSSSPILITGLQSSTQYTYTAVATSVYGTSSSSSPSSGVTATTVPEAPTVGTASPADSSATLTFTAGATGGSTITNYQYSLDGSTYTAFSPAQTSSPLTISGLTNGTNYSFYIKAVNANGVSSASSVSNTVTAGLVEGYYPIQTVTVGAGGASAITFSSIPQTYKHLQIRGTDQQNYGSNDSGYTGIRLNGDTGSNWNRHQIWGTGSSVAAYGLGASNVAWGTVGASGLVGTRTQYFAGNIIDIYDYTSTAKYKTVKAFGGIDLAGASGSTIGLYTAAWQNTAAVTSVTMNGSNGTFKPGSTYTLYGILG